MVLEELPVHIDEPSDTSNDSGDWQALLPISFDLPNADTMYLCKFVRSRGSLVARLQTMAVLSTFGVVKTTKQADMTVVLTIVFLWSGGHIETGCE